MLSDPAAEFLLHFLSASKNSDREMEQGELSEEEIDGKKKIGEGFPKILFKVRAKFSAIS